jgi:type II secretory pathway component GspD/PulD (secretin)
MRRMFLALSVFLLASMDSAHAQQDPNKKFEVYPAGIADFELLAETAKQMASPDGKVIADAAGRRIIVVDKPEVHEQIAKLVKALQVPQQNVRIKVRFDDQGSSNRQGLGVGGTVKSGNVTVTTTGDPKEGIHVNAINQSTHTSSRTEQELLVVNNGSASLDVTREIPYYEWIFNYGLNMGFWTAETKWKPVGARLRVKPTILGDTIRIKLTPEVSRLIDRESVAVSMEKLSTEVIVGNNQEISLGGLPAEVSEFYSKFLVGYDEGGHARSLNIYLKPTIEEPFIAPK